MKKFWTIYTVLCCIFCCEMASAQNLTKISGTVLDENNAPMAGVTISVNGKGATLSTSDGTFTLTNVPTGATISFSFIGYETEKVTVNNPKTVEAIRLVPAENSMREITVVGYGKQERRDITGSVSSVKLDEQKSFLSVDHSAYRSAACSYRVSRAVCPVDRYAIDNIQGIILSDDGAYATYRQQIGTAESSR